jgi:hypothetical protein
LRKLTWFSCIIAGPAVTPLTSVVTPSCFTMLKTKILTDRSCSLEVRMFMERLIHKYCSPALLTSYQFDSKTHKYQQTEQPNPTQQSAFGPCMRGSANKKWWVISCHEVIHLQIYLWSHLQNNLHTKLLKQQHSNHKQQSATSWIAMIQHYIIWGGRGKFAFSI